MTRSPGAGPGHALLLPTPPEPRSAFSFPVVATIAPVLASVAIWLVTHSPFALLFALLGPIVALASLADSSWQGRRHRRRALSRYDDEVAAVAEEIAEHHRVERTAAEVEHPDVDALIGLAATRVGWHDEFGGGVRVGRGRVASSLTVDGSRSARHPVDRVRTSTAALVAQAGWIDRAPIVVDARGGIGFVGPPAVAGAAARACVIRLARVLAPDEWTIAAAHTPATRWLDELPHARTVPSPGGEHTTGHGRIQFVPVGRSPTAGDGRASITIGIAGSSDDLPRRCRVIAEVGRDAGGPAEDGRRDGESDGGHRWRPEFVSIAEAELTATVLTRTARRDGLIAPGLSDLPVSVALASLDNSSRVGDQTGLSCVIGMSTDGPWHVDLVSDGPHAVIGGTTGSGKSELLTSWILAMATRHPPEEVTFLLVDFKGGATFGAITRLPHSVGVITDLDRVQAVRALESLRAEVLHRERVIAESQVRSIDELHALERDPPLPRLVIVVDEFQAMAGEYPELHALFSDLAARGRSLGIHLVLCTQRPATSLRDAILANCALRICLRVNDQADSIAVVGTSEAAALPRTSRGLAIVSVGGDPPIRVQIALAATSDADGAVIASTHGVRRPWCDPLPLMLPLDELPFVPLDAGIAFGMVDLPARQRQEPAVWNPAVDGNLLVLGAFGSGKSTALSTIAARRVTAEVVPSDVEGAWDCVMLALERIDSLERSARLLVIDDIDSLLTRFGNDHQFEFADALIRVLRDGPRHGTVTALAARSATSALNPIAAACDKKLVLRQADRSEHVVAGLRGTDFDERMPRGGGFWRGDRMQVAWSEPVERPAPIAPPPLSFPRGATTAIVSAAPREVGTALAGRAASGELRILSMNGTIPEPATIVSSVDEHLVVIGDLDSWNAAWSLLPAVRARTRLVLHGCSVADFRSITRSRRLPPALDGPRHAWLLVGDAVGRVTVPTRSA